MTNAIQEYIDDVYCVSHLIPMKKKLRDNGYMHFITEEGCLLDNELWVHPDTIEALKDNRHNPKYIFTYTEKYLNDWSSTQIQRRYKKLNKTQIKFLQSIDILF